MSADTCNCGCSTVTTITNVAQACGCGCDCCAPGELTREEEITELRRLRESADAQDTTVDEVVDNINRTYERAART